MRNRPAVLATRPFKFEFALCALLIALTSGRVWLNAQNAVLTGAVSGRVTDQTGAVVPDASVVARNLQTGVERAAKTTRAGIYALSELTPGSYTVTASEAGFRDFQSTLDVQVGNTTVQDFKLKVGASGDTVKVNTAGPILRPEESSASYLLDHSSIPELPLNGRRYTDFTLLTPNTAPDGDTGLVSIEGQEGGEDTGYANGNGWNAFTVDGSNATSNYFDDILGRYRIPYLYGENSIQEFQVAISPYSAIYGGGSSFINAVTRSGGNSYHGNVFYFNRNSAFEANDSVSKAAGYPKQQDNLQQFGASIGGPIRKDRLWFFADYEQQRENDPISVINSSFEATQPAFLSSNFGVPDGTPLPAPNAPYPVPTNLSTADPTNPVYLQQVANAVNALSTNLGVKPRQKNDIVATPRLDFQASSRDSMFLTLNINRFDSPGGVITVSPVAGYGTQTLANAKVNDFQASIGWTHTFSPVLLNEFHAGTSDDNQIATPSGDAPGAPTIIIESPSVFVLGNAPFSIGRVFERQYSVADRVDYTIGKHTLQFGFDFNRAWDSDNNFGGADPNESVQNGSFLGSYQFSNLESFALGQYNAFNQAAGNPTFAFAVPYYGFYVQDTYRVLPKLTIEGGVREDFQVYPQPAANPAFPLTGQFPNQYARVSPRFGFAWQPMPKTVVRGGFGQFYTNFNGLNYRNAVVSNGVPSQEASVTQMFDPTMPANQQTPTFPNILPGNSPLFAASDISLVSPQFKTPYIMQASLQIEQEIDENTSFSIGTMWNHGIHIIAGSAYDVNQEPLQGTTTYITCPPGTTAPPCSGPQITLPNMDSGLLADGALNPNLGQINELISPAQNYYNSLFVQLKHRLSHGLTYQVSYTWAKSIMLDGMDFNNQFDFSNTHAPTLQDQRHNLSIAALYEPRPEQFMTSSVGRALLSSWKLSSVMAFASGRPYAGLLAPSANGNNLNDSAFNQGTSNSAQGINQAGPTPGIGLNSFYGPWLERIDVGLARSFPIGEYGSLQLQAQAFNLFNHANFYVQNGGGVNQTQYNPIGNPGNDNCGDGLSLNQTCYLIPNSGPGNFGSLQEISPNGTPRALQFSARFTF
jgi:hypothetical protein